MNDQDMTWYRYRKKLDCAVALVISRCFFWNLVKQIPLMGRKTPMNPIIGTLFSPSYSRREFLIAVQGLDLGLLSNS